MGEDQWGILVVVADIHQVTDSHHRVEQGKEQVAEQGTVEQDMVGQDMVEQGMRLVAELGKPLEGRRHQGRLEVQSALWW